MYFVFQLLLCCSSYLKYDLAGKQVYIFGGIVNRQKITGSRLSDKSFETLLLSKANARFETK